MTSRCIATVFAILFATMVFASSVIGQEKFQLKPGAKGKLCLSCHEEFKEKLKLPFIHSPVKSGSCSDCHNPHASRHGKLIASGPNEICFSCHKGLIAPGARSSHKIVANGSCSKCHDPHASKNKFNLKAAGNQLCFECHKEYMNAVANKKFKHILGTKECLTCHNAHSSSKAAFLLKEDVPNICNNCHDMKKPILTKQHMNYPMGNARCTSCHDPHGSNRAGILWENAHSPVVNKMCNQCHQDSKSTNALGLRREGVALCRGCHSNTVGGILGKKRIHWPLADNVACLNCHSPHASKQASLLTDEMKPLCGKCHSDTIAKQNKATVKHKPADEGNCTKCHSPHAANYAFLFDNESTLALCGKCHEWQKHSTHPIGEKVVDPRNPNITMDCLSCHRSHGTDQKYFTYSNPDMDLCVMCHQKYKR